MNIRLVLNVKKGNYFGYFSGTEYGLILGKVVECTDTLVTFDNSQVPVDYASIRRIEINQLNCESFGWERDPKTLCSFIINDKSAVVFDNGQPVLAYKVTGTDIPLTMFQSVLGKIFLLFKRIEVKAIRLFVLGNERVKKGLIKALRLQNCNSFLLLR